MLVLNDVMLGEPRLQDGVKFGSGEVYRRSFYGHYHYLYLAKNKHIFVRIQLCVSISGIPISTGALLTN